MTEVFQETVQQNILHAHPGRVSSSCLPSCIPDKIYFVPLKVLDLSVRLYNIFQRAGISLAGQILEMSPEELEHLKLGERSIDEVARQMKAFGLLDLIESDQEEFTEIIPTLQEEAAFDAPRASTTISLNRRLQSRFAYAVAVSRIPSRYRERLPHQSRICFVEEPTPLYNDPDTYTVRIAVTLAALTTSKAIHLRINNEKQSRELAVFQRLIQDATTQPQALTASKIRVAPSPFLPEGCVGMCHRPATTMLSDEEVLIPDIFYVEETGITRIAPETGERSQLVNVSELPGRLTGYQSGPVYSVWMKEALIAQSPVWDEKSPTWDGSLASLDTHDRRIEVVKSVRAQGGTVPTTGIPEDAATSETTITEQFLRDLKVAPLKDPVFLRKEDVEETNDPVDILESVMHITRLQHEAVVAQMQQRLEQFEKAQTATEKQALLEQQRNDRHEAKRLQALQGWLEETMIWYTSLPKKRRQRRIFSLEPRLVEVKEPVLTPKKKQIKRHKGQPMFQMVPQAVSYQFVGIATRVPLPWKYALPDLMGSSVLPTGSLGQPKGAVA